MKSYKVLNAFWVQSHEHSCVRLQRRANGVDVWFVNMLLSKL